MPASDLANAAEATIALGAGPELAVAATKTYVNTLGALALLAGHIAGRGAEIEAGTATPRSSCQSPCPGSRRRRAPSPYRSPTPAACS